MNSLSFLADIAGYAQAQTPQTSAARPMRLATIDPGYIAADFAVGSLPRVIFDGEFTTSGKFYPVMRPYWPMPGDRVMLAPVGNTYVILGALSDGEGWQPFFCTWGASTTAPVLNDGTLVAEYQQYGQTTDFRIHLTLGAGTSIGSGRYTFTLPIPPVGNGQAAAAWVADGSTRYACSAILTTGSGIFGLAYGTGAAGVSHNLPFTFGSGDQIAIWGRYKAQI